MSDASHPTYPRTTKLGTSGPEVFPISLGCMGMSGMYGASSDDESIATIHEAIERGVTLLDTGDFYGMGHNEMLIGRALRERPGTRDKVQLSVKFGGLRTPEGGFSGIDTRPVAVKNFVAYSLKRLGVDVIDVYRPARLDPAVPIEDTIGAIAELVQKGYVRHIGLSEVGVDTIRRAQKVHPIVDLQIEYSLVSRGPEDRIFAALDELGISATLYGLLSRGLLGGSKPSGSDFRQHLPRFAEKNRAQNDAVVRSLQDFAKARNMTSAQVAIAWALAKQPKLVPVVGARTREQLRSALDVLTHAPLSAADITELETLVPKDAIAGTRYQAEQMAHLDSER